MSRALCAFVALWLGGASFCSYCRGQSSGVTLDGERFSGELAAIDAQGVARFTTRRSLPLDHVVRWGSFVAARPQPIVVLVGGSRVVAAAAWTGAAPVTLIDGKCIVTSDLLQDVRLPRQLVRGIVYGSQESVFERARMEEQIHELSGLRQDVVLLVNGDRLHGSATALSADTLTWKSESGAAAIPISRIRAVSFGDDAPQQDKPAGGRAAAGLRDGSLLVAESIRADQSSLEIQLAELGVVLSGGTAADIVALQSLGGERLVYLSDLKPSGYRHVPYLSLEWPYRRDRGVSGRTLTVNGQPHLKGLGMHSAARLTYTLNPADGWRRFETEIAVDDIADGGGSVTFGVYVERSGQWQSAYTSGIVRGGDPPQTVSVDVNGATGLTLTVDYADRGDELDHADWLDARLLK